MRFRILDARSPADRQAWLALWHAWPGREVQAHPEYVLLFARPEDRTVCAVGEGDGTVLFPLILRPLAQEAWAAGDARLDATTPYGYGGPYAWGGPRDDAAFWRAYGAWAREAGVVTTFARLPLFEDELPALAGEVEARAPNIVVPLTTEDALWRGYEGKVRKWVGVAEKAGLEVEVDERGARLADFVRIYTHTMERNGASAWYFFPRAFFEAIVQRLPGQFAFFHTLRAGEVVSSDLVLLSARHAYYFLGGTHADAFPLGPNYLLKHRIARWALAQGKQGYVLGGGYEPGDGLYRYKRGYARNGEVPFRTLALTHDERACAELAARRAAHASAGGAPWAPRPGFFPGYRA